MKKECFIWQLFLILLISASLASIVNGQGYTPLYGVHTDPGMIYSYPDSIPGFVRTCAANGYSAIMYMIVSAYPDTINGYADYRFVSPTLDSLGWTFEGDHLSQFVTVADSYNIDVFVDLQGLAYVALDTFDGIVHYPLVTPPSVNDVVNIVYELAGYGIAGISEEMFLAEWFAPVYQACQDSSLIYIHKAIHWDFGAMSHYWNYSTFEVYSNCHVIMTEDYDMIMDRPWMAACEQFPSIAGWLGKEYQTKVSADDWALRSLANAENVALLKAIQFRPTYIYIMTWNTGHVDSFANDMVPLIQEHVPEEEVKPLCNVVLYLTSDEDPDTWDQWGMTAKLASVSTGIKASGYDIITSSTPIDTADMYYIHTRGDWVFSTTLDLPDSIVQLFDSGKPIFLQLTQRLPNTTPNWDTIRARLGIDTTTFATIQNIDTILYGTYNGIEYAHLRSEMWLNNISPENVTSGEVLSTGVLGGDTFALIVRKGNNYFINGTSLNLEASFPISNLINDGLQKPTACVVTAGKTSVFYALDIIDSQWDRTELHIKLPDSLTTQISWFKRDFNGVMSSGTASYDPNIGYIDTLSEGTLLILESLQAGVGSPNSPAEPGVLAVHLFQSYPNPFNSQTTISYQLPVRGNVTLKIYDVLGRKVRTLVDENQTAGNYSVIWDGKNDSNKSVGSGVYFCQVKGGDFTQTNKLLLLK